MSLQLIPQLHLEYVRFPYPYHSRRLYSIFVYGTDYKRSIDIFRVSNLIKIVIALIALLLIVAILTLYTMRKLFKFPSSDAVSCTMDCLVLFIGGGNPRMGHRFERWFFGILMTGAFFIVSIFGGDLVDSVVRILNSKVRTLEDVIEINPSIHIETDLATNTLEILAMLT